MEKTASDASEKDEEKERLPRTGGKKKGRKGEKEVCFSHAYHEKEPGTGDCKSQAGMKSARMSARLSTVAKLDGLLEDGTHREVNGQQSN